MSDIDNLKEGLVEMKSCQRFQLLFEKSKLDDFCCIVTEALPNLAKEAIRMSFLFTTIYFCETGFSAMTYMKNKHRNRPQSEDDLWATLSKIEPSFKRLVMMKQQQKSLRSA